MKDDSVIGRDSGGAFFEHDRDNDNDDVNDNDNDGDSDGFIFDHRSNGLCG